MGTLPSSPAQTSREPSARPGLSLADALFTDTQKRVLSLLFGQPKRSFYVTELIELAQGGRGAVQRELARLERAGLVLTSRRGNQKHYLANPDSPLFGELCSIIRKTLGIEEQVRTALGALGEKLELALIYGSVAKQSDTAASDIDLLIVSDDLTLEEVYTALADAESHLRRQINPTLYRVAEYKKRCDERNPFLMEVLAGPVTLLKGTLSAS